MSKDLLWRVLKSDLVADCRVFSVYENFSQNEGRQAGKSFNFYTIKAHNWVNVIPVTDEGNVVLITQFRHGLSEVTLEIPGGMVDEGEDPAHAARRELLEETGYLADELICLGFNHPNPAIQDNKCFSYLATNARKVQEPQFDTTEDIDVMEVPLIEIPKLIKTGAISHALVITAFHMHSLLD